MSERSRAEAGLDRLAELRARAIEKYGIKDDDQRADMLASLMLAHERMTEAIAAGERGVNYGDFAKIIDMLRDETPPVIPRVELTVIGPDGKNATTQPGESIRDVFLRARPQSTPQGAAQPDPTPAAANPSPTGSASPTDGQVKPSKAKAKATEPASNPNDPPPLYKDIVKDTRTARPGFVPARAFDQSQALGWFGDANKQASSCHQHSSAEPSSANPHPYKDRHK